MKMCENVKCMTPDSDITSASLSRHQTDVTAGTWEMISCTITEHGGSISYLEVKC